MMHGGIEFIEADNALIVASAIYKCRQPTDSDPYRDKIYRYRSGPHGTWVEEVERGDKGWEQIGESHRVQWEEDLIPFLPTERGLWDHNRLILALSFWAEGNKIGHNQGETRGYRQAVNHQKAEVATELQQALEDAKSARDTLHRLTTFLESPTPPSEVPQETWDRVAKEWQQFLEIGK